MIVHHIRPGIVHYDEYGDKQMTYPTNFEWLLAFALKGCQWAIDAIPVAIENHNREEVLKSLGENI